MRKINACRFFGILLLLLGCICTALYIHETQTEDSVYVLLFMAVPLFIALGAGLTVLPLSSKSVSDIIGDKSLIEILNPINIKQLLNFDNVPVWKQVVYAVLIIGAIIVSVVMFIKYVF
jgi:hypothetical protein